MRRGFHLIEIPVTGVLMVAIIYALARWWPAGSAWFLSYDQLYWYMGGAFVFWLTGKAVR